MKIKLFIITILMILPVSVFALSDAEMLRLDAVFALLGQESQVVFIRNGTEYGADAAVSHLRLKLGNVKNRVKTAEEFIEKAGSGSSISGKPYLIRTADNVTQEAGPYLKTLLKKADMNKSMQ